MDRGNDRMGVTPGSKKRFNYKWALWLRGISPLLGGVPAFCYVICAMIERPVGEAKYCSGAPGRREIAGTSSRLSRNRPGI